jgi:streptogramin lyase
MAGSGDSSGADSADGAEVGRPAADGGTVDAVAVGAVDATTDAVGKNNDGRAGDLFDGTLASPSFDGRADDSADVSIRADSADAPLAPEVADVAARADVADGGSAALDGADTGPSLPTETRTIVEFAIPMVGIYYSMPVHIAAGSDGNMWFTSSNRNNIGRITPNGTITEFAIPTGRPFTSSSNPGNLVLGPDGNLWFPESSKIARISPDGVIVEMDIPSPGPTAKRITFGPDGALWFTENNKDAVARLTTEGALTEYPVPSVPRPRADHEEPFGITTGPDGNIWFTNLGGADVARMSPSGALKQFKLPWYWISAWEIAAGGDGALWFVEDQYRLGRMTTSGDLTEVQLPTGDTPETVKAGPDGNLWVAVRYYDDGYVLRISPSGELTKFAIPTANGGPMDVAVGPDGKIWFTQYAIDHIGYFVP